MENKRYHIVIASILFAALTWISVNLKDEFTVVKHLPVVLENLKEGKALKYPVPKSVNVRFRGSGWSLAGLYLSPDLKYYIDLSSASSEDYIITHRDLLEHVKLPTELQPLDVKPDTMIIALDEYTEIRIPIIPNIMLSYHEGYGQVGALQVIPESVTIGGARSLIKNIGGLPTIYKKLDDVRAPIDMNIPFDEPNNYSINILNPTVRIQVNVQPFAERTFTGIPLTITSLPSNREILFIPPKIDIVVRGGIEQLEKLTNEDFQAMVDYQSLVRDSLESIVPVLSVPPEIKVLSKKPEKFQFVIRKKL